MEIVTNNQQQDICDTARDTILTEIAALQSISDQAINADFAAACELILKAEGRVIVVGMGKSGHIGRKIAATFASTGTPAFFVHPAEANHGDIGMMTPQDVILMISYSGETQEVLSLIPNLKQLGIAVISITGNPDSTLAKLSKINLNIHIGKEACPMGLAPTSSTTATLVLGDALAVSLLQVRGFTPEDFAFFHPGGSLGKKLLLQVNDVMYKDTQLPIVHESCTVDKALLEVTQKSLGVTLVVNDAKTVNGIFTDGDLRRTLDKGYDIKTTTMLSVMTRDFRKIEADMLASKALQIMKHNKITSLVVVNRQQQPVGLLHMHALLRAGVI
ncbi:MAG: KpsF/GutQ family sugar-phosphate isomerase [Gammaproteobacteria bacterium]|nr:KpsF/GutQ family sugar-phosphate isomerase [Gammaproteobacteria bacterium]MCH9745045.1 KpsF/GutQ family sugar-phosphate isomerase [Gammaproteobacteria bacterium]